MLRASAFALTSLVAVLATAYCHAEEPKTLMGMIAEWQYPDSKINGASVDDAATMNKAGQRTQQSIQYKTVLTTADPMAKVLKYYKTKLKPVTNPEASKPDGNLATTDGRSVTYHDDSENRPLSIHVILVNTKQSSTTLVISRAETETETHIAWAHYLRF